MEGRPAGDALASPRASFGYLVRRRRKILDLTQEALAGRVGGSTATIKKIEHDERRPSITMARRLAEALELPLEDVDLFVAAAMGERAASRVPMSAPKVNGSRSRFAGRDAELALLDSHLEAALAGASRWVFVTGEAGQGKSALLTEFLRRAHLAQPDLIVARGVATSVAGQSDPYLPFRDLFYGLVGERGVGLSGAARAAHADRIAAFAPLVVGTVARLAPQLADALLPRGLPVARRVGGVPASRDQLMGEVADVLAELSAERPLLLVLDDLQWLDRASAELAFHLHRRLEDARVLLVGAYRPSEVVWGPEQASRPLRQLVLEVRRDRPEALIDLGTFDAVTTRAFCDALIDLEPNDIPDDLRDRLTWQTRGHPLFLLELMKELRHRGHLHLDESGVLVAGGSIDWNHVPDRVASVIEQRLSRIDDQHRHLLDVAAVEGESFTAEVVAEVAGLDLTAVLRALDRHLGTELQLVMPDPDAVDDGLLTHYRFSHALFQHYLYEQLGPGERRHLHRRVGGSIEALHGRDTALVTGVLAHHFRAGDDRERAIAYLVRAGDQARNVYAYVEAVDHYGRAVELLRHTGDHERLARTLMKLGLSHQIGYDHQAAQHAYDEAFRLWSVPGPAVTTTATLRSVWREPPSLDPTLGGYNVTAPLATQLFSGLVGWGEDNEILPDVAQRWSLEEGGRRLVFHLRDDVFWHDGEPVTAHDFVFTYRRAVDPATSAHIAASLLDPVVGARRIHAGEDVPLDGFGVRAADDRTLVIELEEPTSWFLPNLGYYVLLPTPQHVVQRHGAAWADPPNLIGNGPFRLVSWDRGASIVLERNARFHGRSIGNVRRIELDLGLAYDDIGARYDDDGLDLVTNFTVPARVMAALARRHPSEHRQLPAFIVHWLHFDLTVPPFDDARVRHALAMALGPETFVLEVLGGLATPARGGIVPAGLPGHLPDLGRSHDLAAARRLLEAAGVSGGRGLVLRAFDLAEPSHRFVQRAWRDVGFPVELEVVDTLEQWRSDLGPATVAGWIADYPDPDTVLRVMVGPPVEGWERSGEYERLLEEATHVLDQGERLKRYQRAERLLIDDAVFVPLAYIDWQVVHKPWVTNFCAPAVKHPGFWHQLQVGPRPPTP
jgi:ABC-type transport system substrate-binding protein/transcriptional regulator with XRE-family HTH domain